MKKVAVVLSLSLILGFSPQMAQAASPIQITKVTLFKRFPTFVILRVTGQNRTNHDVHAAGYLHALDSDGYTTYEDPDFNEVNMYGVNNYCTGGTVDGYWSGGQVATATWCFAVPKGRTIKSVYVSGSMFGTAMYSKAVSIRN